MALDPDEALRTLRQAFAQELSGHIDQLSAMPTNPTNERAEMPETAVAKTQDALAKKAIEQLAIIGGALTRDDDITYNGKAWNVPAQYRGNLRGAGRDFTRFVESMEEQINVSRTFNYRPYDGAHATYQMLKKYFGYAQSKARQGMFGKIPPPEVDISIGYIDGKEQRMTVPFGSDMVLPGLPGAVMTISQTRSTLGMVLHLSTVCRRADKESVEGFYAEVQRYLDDNSIYRGKAVNGAMEFIDTDKIDPSLFVYSEQTWADAETHIFSPMRDADLLKSRGYASKRVVLLEGPYGGGKSGLGRTASKVAVAAGWTAIIARPGVDDPFDVLNTARLYQPALIFIEDVDTIAASMDPNYVTKLLDTFDGFGTKDLKMQLVLTTNHADRIHKGMLRPGRLDALIHIGFMDRPGVERLARIVCRDALRDDIDYDAVFAATDGYMPAFVREGLERSIRYSIARTREVANISTEDLVHSLGSLRAQHNMQQAASDQHEKLPPLDAMFRKMIVENATPDMERIEEAVDERIEYRINGATLVKPNGERLANIQTN